MVAAAFLSGCLGCGTSSPESPPPTPSTPTRPAPIPSVPEPPGGASPAAEVPVEPVPSAAPSEEEAVEPEADDHGFARDEEGLFLQRRELLSMDRIGEGPLAESSAEAALAGFLDPTEDNYGYGDEASLDVGRATYVLVRAPGGLPEYAATATEHLVGAVRSALWLVHVVSETTEDGVSYRRRQAVRLSDLVLPNDLANDATCEVPSEIRARDLDGDGETELTVIAALAPLFVGRSSDTCAATAFLVGADLQVQARFVREYQLTHFDAGGEYEIADDTTWVVRDVNGDGHADLHVVEHFTLRDDFEGDWGGDDVGTIPGHHAHRDERRDTNCPWDAATDTWICAAVDGHMLGQRLLLSPAALVAAPNGAVDAPPW